MKSINCKNLIINLGLVVFSLITLLVIIEAYLLIVGYNVLKNYEGGRGAIYRFSSDNNLKYELVPGRKTYINGIKFEINEHGHRGQMGMPGKFGGFRIIVLGDSITFGFRLPNESTYSYQLNELLNNSSSESKEYQVLNFGVSGYDTIQEVFQFERQGLIYKPDLVIVGFCLNDVGIVNGNLKYITFFLKYQSSWFFRFRVVQLILDKISKVIIRALHYRDNRSSVFQEEYKTKIALIDENEHELRGLMSSSSNFKWYSEEYRIGRLRYAFEYLASLAKKEKFKVVVVIFPKLILNSNNYPYETAHKIVTLEAERVGFDVIDVLNEFIEIGMSNLKISENDFVHPNYLGNKIIAKELASYIYDKRTIDE